MMKHLQSLVVAVLLVTLCQGQNECEGDLDDSATLTACLNYIREVSTDVDQFWFGSGFEARCGDSVAPSCYNPNDYSDRTHLSLFLSAGESELDDLDRFIYVRYDSDEWEYSACGTTVTSEATEFDLDMSLTTHFPATTTALPEVEWDFEEGDLFTVMLVDPPFSMQHGIWINVEGNDIESGDEIVSYLGPMHMNEQSNPYTWLVFKQPSGAISMTDDYTDRISTRTFVSTLSDFKSDMGLVGPVAMNFQMMTTDLFAAGMFNNLAPNRFQLCSAYVEEDLNDADEEWLTDDVTLTAFLTVSMETEDTEYEYCDCVDEDVSGQTTVLDPIGNEIIDSVYVRTGSTLSFSITATGTPPAISDFEGKRYVVMMMDPDAPSSSSRPLLHFFSYNLEVSSTSDWEADLTNAVNLVSYLGPAPPDLEDTHTYYLLLAEQEDGEWDSDMADLNGYTFEEGCFDTNRCLFDVSTYMTDKNLAITAASWMRVQNDDYINAMNGLDESDPDVCDDRCPDPDNGAQGIVGGVSLFGLLISASVVVLQMVGGY